MREELEPLELAARELVVRAAVPPVLVRVRAVVVRIEPRRGHHVHGALDRRCHVLRVGVVPGDDRLEALVEVDLGPDGVMGDVAAELAQARDRALALGESRL